VRCCAFAQRTSRHNRPAAVGPRPRLVCFWRAPDLPGPEGDLECVHHRRPLGRRGLHGQGKGRGRPDHHACAARLPKVGPQFHARGVPFAPRPPPPAPGARPVWVQVCAWSRQCALSAAVDAHSCGRGPGAQWAVALLRGGDHLIRRVAGGLGGLARHAVAALLLTNLGGFSRKAPRTPVPPFQPWFDTPTPLPIARLVHAWSTYCLRPVSVTPSPRCDPRTTTKRVAPTLGRCNPSG